jgi:Spy/CpxP family protein refolding chaperone
MKYLATIFTIGALSFVAFAQDKPAAPTNQTLRTNINSLRGPQRFDRAALDLNPEHRAKLEEINRAFSTNATPLYSRLSTARRELEAFVSQDTFDESAIRAKAKEISDLEADLAIARAKRYSKLRAFLTPEQARRFSSGAPLARPFQPRLHEGQVPPPVAPNK